LGGSPIHREPGVGVAGGEDERQSLRHRVIAITHRMDRHGP
jgi:hypothetical protein